MDRVFNARRHVQGVGKFEERGETEQSVTANRHRLRITDTELRHVFQAQNSFMHNRYGRLIVHAVMLIVDISG